MAANTAHSPSDIDVQIIQGEAPTIYIYRVDAGELERLTNASNPIPLAICGIGIGAFFSLLPTVVGGLGNLGTTSFGKSDLAYTIAIVIALLVGVIAGTIALKNDSVVKAVLADIKRRAT
ncbi:hypothetical protein [Novosphingobium sp. PhB165]|uniref:hypothetical protein n=1 Tax=Novosphingobium sp. PhB165 TaxID=2485105 RepID=UPI001050E000|nr:hypothetical protein [Novosphingobium sp. PhB165]